MNGPGLSRLTNVPVTNSVWGEVLPFGGVSANGDPTLTLVLVGILSDRRERQHVPPKSSSNWARSRCAPGPGVGAGTAGVSSVRAGHGLGGRDAAADQRHSENPYLLLSSNLCRV